MLFLTPLFYSNPKLFFKLSCIGILIAGQLVEVVRGDLDVAMPESLANIRQLCPLLVHRDRSCVARGVELGCSQVGLANVRFSSSKASSLGSGLSIPTS